MVNQGCISNRVRGRYSRSWCCEEFNTQHGNVTGRNIGGVGGNLKHVLLPATEIQTGRETGLYA
jgi:hypothetical protein